jgi:hypothetical protein
MAPGQRADVMGIAKGEHTTVRADYPVATAVRGGDHADDVADIDPEPGQ